MSEQDIIRELKALNQKFDTINGKTPELSNGKVPVVSSSTPLPSGAATENTLEALLIELRLKADLAETQPISVASLPLPTGAATENTLSVLSTKIETQALSAIVGADAKALATINVPAQLQAVRGKLDGWSLVLKSGKNPDIDTGTVPEDVWNGGGVYTGFPTGAPEELQVFSSSALDVGTVTFLYLANSSSTVYQSHTVAINGTTIINTGITAYRIHSASFSSTANTATTFNQGIISIRHRTTTTNVFIAMPVATNQSYMAGYTIPAGHTGYLIRNKWVLSGGSTSSFSDVAFWIRLSGQSPRLRRNDTVVFGSPSISSITGGLALPAGTDIIPRVNTASANNLIVVCSYDILLIPN